MQALERENAAFGGSAARQTDAFGSSFLSLLFVPARRGGERNRGAATSSSLPRNHDFLRVCTQFSLGFPIRFSGEVLHRVCIIIRQDVIYVLECGMFFVKVLIFFFIINAAKRKLDHRGMPHNNVAAAFLQGKFLLLLQPVQNFEFLHSTSLCAISHSYFGSGIRSAFSRIGSSLYI